MSNSEKILFLILLFFVVTAGAQSTPPSFPSVAVFSGWVEINGEYAPKGTVVVAKISGDEVCSYTLESEEQYKIVVEGTTEDSGMEIEFYIDGIKADQTAEWEAGGIVDLDLSVSIPSEEESTTSTSSSTSLTSTSTIPPATTTLEITTTSTTLLHEIETTVPTNEETTTIKQRTLPEPSSQEFNPTLLLVTFLAVILFLLLAIIMAMVKRK